MAAVFFIWPFFFIFLVVLISLYREDKKTDKKILFLTGAVGIALLLAPYINDHFRFIDVELRFTWWPSLALYALFSAALFVWPNLK